MRSDPALRPVLDYYRHVDADEVGALVALFAEESVYHRPGYPPLRGHADLRRFYTAERVIAGGRHRLATIVRDDRTVAVSGTFDGTLKDGTAVSVGFADFFTLTADGRFAERRTYFDAAAV
ncbi:nuclear transport factor 2 family protein [Actinoplanes sp. NPDC051859]|uniref:nuclear transport factor 2 family protein n=1 Tax=Actinoplanes sp. NPDC051859 TaxID=3363909 RepID=UPI0037B91637